MSKFIDFNDSKIPIGKRKVAYVKWAISKGTDKIEAMRQANNKFGFEQKPGIVAIVRDFGRMCQASFGGADEIFDNYDLRRYKQSKIIYRDQVEKLLPGGKIDSSEIERMIDIYKSKGWKIVYVDLAC